MAKTETIAFWFRRDFRLHDNHALAKMMQRLEEREGEWLAIFWLEPKLYETHNQSTEYFLQALDDFKMQLESKGIHLHIIYGSELQFVEIVTKNLPSLKELYFNKAEVGESYVSERTITELFKTRGIRAIGFDDAHVVPPKAIVKKDGSIYKVFSAYFRQWEKKAKALPYFLRKKDLALQHLHRPALNNEGEVKLQFYLCKCRKKWTELGEKRAQAKLEAFLGKRVESYHYFRDSPVKQGSSVLSPFIRTGTLSVRTIYNHVLEDRDVIGEGAQKFIKELAWRDFYHMVYYYYPESKEKAVISKFNNIQWQEDETKYMAWCNGKTGFPFVDAAMRQLLAEGWIHNRLRMVVASFLTKDLLIDWRSGERYFASQLIDYDEASNIGGWQWAASVGFDSAPYFRIFNPITQSKRFDPNGDFIKKYVQELQDVPVKYVHEPWKLPIEEQKAINCVVGQDYPYPIVDHKIQRERAILLFKEVNE